MFFKTINKSEKKEINMIDDNRYLTGCYLFLLFVQPKPMDSSTNFQFPPQAAYFLWSCYKVYHKEEACILLYFLGQIVSLKFNPNLLD